MNNRGAKFRGFPFDEEDTGAWSQLAARHPDIAARLRSHPQTWARKRRPSGNDQTEDFGGFPFDDIPPEFREHLPSNWNRRFPEEQTPQGQPPQQAPQHYPQGQYPPQGQSTQYQAQPQQFQGPLPQQYQGPPPKQYQGPPAPPQQQYHQQQSYPPNYQQPPPPPHRVTISTQTEPDFINPPQNDQNNGVNNSADIPQHNQEAGFDEKNQRSMSAPPETYANQPNMSQSPPRSDQSHQNEHSNVRHIPIFVEGRNEPVINRAPHAAEAKPTYQQAPPHPHVEREQFYPEEAPSFHHPPNFSRAFGSPFNKGFRQGPQPFSQQRAYPQAAFGRANSPKRSQSPQLHPEEHFVKVPVHHERPDTPSRPQPPPKPQQQHQPPPPQQSQSPPPQPPKPQTPPSNDPITQILSVQTDVLNLMTEVENFTGKKNDKQYLYLDEMLTRNLIKLDNIETEGKENIRQARKEAIRCIQKCIAVLETKATGGAAPAPDVDMDNSNQGETKNGEVEMKEETKDDAQIGEQTPAPVATDESQPQASDTRPDQVTADPTQENKDQAVDEKKTKKKVVKKRDKSKDAKDSPKDSNKKGDKKLEAMQVDDKGDKESSQTMDVDSAAASQ